MTKHTIKIRKDGVIEWLAPSPIPFPILSQSKIRYSEIIPRNPVKRALFRLLRLCFGETGRVSEWTRGWRCVWHAEILLGPHKGETMESGLRGVLLEFERERWFKPCLCLDQS